MPKLPALFRLQEPNDHDVLVALNEKAFGPGRFARSAYRVREGAMREPRLNLCAVREGEIVGAVDFTPVTIDRKAGALLLGPLIVAEGYQNQGYGLRIMLEGLDRARKLGYRLVILVGDLPYYARAGFSKSPPGRFVFPGPVDPARILHVERVPAALNEYQGLIRGIPAP